MDEFLDIDFGDRSKSLSDLYKKDSLLCGKLAERMRPDDGLAASMPGLLLGDAPFSTSKLKTGSESLRIFKLSRDISGSLALSGGFRSRNGESNGDTGLKFPARGEQHGKCPPYGLMKEQLSVMSDPDNVAITSQIIPMPDEDSDNVVLV